ncbi:DUF6069 family protein [Tersicoccus sp. MR15.9]|uniref:DUF6069 family protein n=1 Tax=Tersicoccus mangrovi TaxID=3121635 RepID=UPI002FE61BA1
MPTTATVTAPRRTHCAGLRSAAVLAAAAVVAVTLNSLVALVARAAGAPADYGPLTLPAQAMLTVIGLVVGWIGWRLVQRRARDPRRTLRVLVPAVVLVSFVPDVLLLALRFIPGTTTVGVLALMVMHLVVAAVAITAYRLAAGDGRPRSV